MSIDMISLVWSNSRQRGARRLMMLAIADYADERGMAWPSVPTLARKCMMSERYASDVLRAILEDDTPELTVVETGGGRFKSNVYMISINPEAGFQNPEARLRNPEARLRKP